MTMTRTLRNKIGNSPLSSGAGSIWRGQEVQLPNADGAGCVFGGSSSEIMVQIVKGKEAILSRRKLLCDLSMQCDGSDVFAHLEYFLGLEYRLPREAVLIFVGMRDETGEIPKPLGAMLIYEYCVLGFGTRVFATDDVTGRRTVIAPPGIRHLVGRIGTEVLMRSGAVAVMVRQQADPQHDSALTNAGSWSHRAIGTRWRSASRVRETPWCLLLGATNDETLASLGPQTRKNLRRYRRRAETELGCTFVSDVSISMAEFHEFNKQCSFAADERKAERRLRTVKSMPSMFLHGLRDREGRWISMVAGRRSENTVEADWGLNRRDLSGYSLGTVMRAFLIEYEVSRGTKRIFFEGGTAHLIQNRFARQHVLDLLVVRRPWMIAGFRGIAQHLMPEVHPMRQVLLDPTLSWRPWSDADGGPDTESSRETLPSLQGHLHPMLSPHDPYESMKTPRPFSLVDEDVHRCPAEDLHSVSEGDVHTKEIPNHGAHDVRDRIRLLSIRALLVRLLSPRNGEFAVVQTAIANVLVQVANIASGIITARALGPGGRGTLAAVIMWPQFLAFASTFGVPVASLYWLKRCPELSRQVVGASLALSSIFGVVAAVAGMAIIPLSLHPYPPATIHLAQMWLLVTPLAMLAVTLTSQVQAAEAFGQFNLFRLLSPWSVVLVLLAVDCSKHLTVRTAAWAYLFAATPATIWFGVWTIRHYRPTFRHALDTSQMLLGYGIRAWGADLLGTIANQIDRILVVGLLNPESMGLYVVAQSAAGVLAVLPSAVVPVSLPHSSGRNTEGILSITGKAVRATLYVMICASIPLLVLGRVFLKMIYGPKFLHSYVALPFLVVEAIADGLTSVLSQAFLAAGLPGTVTLLQASGLATCIPLLYLLIPRFGLAGAAFALMISTLFRFGLVLLNFPFRLKSPPPGFIMDRIEFVSLLNRLFTSVHAE